MIPPWWPALWPCSPSLPAAGPPLTGGGPSAGPGGVAGVSVELLHPTRPTAAARASGRASRRNTRNMILYPDRRNRSRPGADDGLREHRTVRHAAAVPRDAPCRFSGGRPGGGRGGVAHDGTP